MLNVKGIVSDDQKHQDALDEDIKNGELSMSGSTPDLESDDNVLDSAHAFGLYEDQDEEHSGELGVAEEVKKAELEHLLRD